MPNSSSYKHLVKKWSAREKELKQNLWKKHKDSFEFLEKHSKQFAIGSLGSLILLTAAGAPLLFNNRKVLIASETKAPDKSLFLITDLRSILPEQVAPLTPEQEQKIGEVLTKNFGIKASAELDGKRLNRSYGLIGKEQHLARYPGDTMASHFDNNEEASRYAPDGMAPGLGAFGYFAPSYHQFTQKDVQREKYYLAVQTFMVPDYVARVAEYRDFFKFRKMLVVNPQNGKAVVAVIADSGPAVWTGKHLGGSPEVMNYLERVDGAGRGPVLYFFIEDPTDKIPLGPINVIQ